MFFLLFVIILESFICQSYAIDNKNIPADFEAKKPYIEAEIETNIPLGQTITYTEVPRGIILSVAQCEIFDELGEITPDGKKILYHISNLLNNFDNNCTIEVHTEINTPKNSLGEEDWEISIIRANKIAEYLSMTINNAAERLFPIGFGAIMPFKGNVSTKDFPNNRIDFVIFDYTVTR